MTGTGRHLVGAVLLAAPVCALAQQAGQPLHTLADLKAAIWKCKSWVPAEFSDGRTDVTIRFSLKRSGELIGEPRITYVSEKSDADKRAAHSAAAVIALRKCTPFNLTESLGGAVAGKIITITFRAGEQI